MAGCALPQQPLTLVTYNVQNLFDGVEDGTEYPRYSLSAGWSQDDYYRRLSKLGRVLAHKISPRPHIIALQEVENRGVAEDLVHDFLRAPWHVAMAPTTEGAVRVVLLSRLPIRSVRIHRSEGIAVAPGSRRSRPVSLWTGREIVDARLDPTRTVTRIRRPRLFWHFQSPGGTVRVLVCHWKSQAGGERETEPQRIQSAALLVRLLVSDKAAELRQIPLTLVVGDLNEDVQEFRQHSGAYETALMPLTTAPASERTLYVTGEPELAGYQGDRVVAYSPWFSASASGSYHHAGQWERLDQILAIPSVPGGWELSLSTINDPELLTHDGLPARYDPRRGWGISDHLPVRVEVRTTTGL